MSCQYRTHQSLNWFSDPFWQLFFITNDTQGPQKYWHLQNKLYDLTCIYSLCDIKTTPVLFLPPGGETSSLLLPSFMTGRGSTAPTKNDPNTPCHSLSKHEKTKMFWIPSFAAFLHFSRSLLVGGGCACHEFGLLTIIKWHGVATPIPISSRWQVRSEKA